MSAEVTVAAPRSATGPDLTRAARAGRAYLATGSLLLVAAVLLFSVVVQLTGVDLFIRHAADDASIQAGDIEQFLGAIEGLGVAYLAVFVVAGISWLWWLHGRIVLLRDLSAPIGTRPAVAIAWWFVPLANAIKPYLIVRDIGRRSASVIGIGAPDGLVTAWWSTFVAGEVIVRISAAASRSVTTLDGMNAVFIGTAIGQAMGIVAIALGVAVIWRLQLAVSLVAATARGTAAATAARPRARARPVWLVVVLTLLSGGAYAGWWFGRTWIEVLRPATGDRRGGLWHAIGTALPIYGSIRTYRHFAAIARLPGSGRSLDPRAAMAIVTAGWLMFPTYYALAWPATLVWTLGWAAAYALIVAAGERSLQRHLALRDVRARAERSDIFAALLCAAAAILIVLPPDRP